MAILGGMRDKQLYTTILGIEHPWVVSGVDLRPKDEEIRVIVRWKKDVALHCPECGEKCPGYDTKRRSWRHLDTCQYHTILEAEVPRTECEEHGVLLIRVPWAEPKGRFTALFESLVIDWLKEASFTAVARRMRLSWDEVDGIQARAVKRGLERREELDLRRIGVDETSYKKRHEYVTVVNDLDRERVVFVADDRKEETLSGFYRSLSEEKREKIEAVAMDMWQPYIMATAKQIPGAEDKIAFDRFHVSKHLNEAVDKVRRSENRELVAAGDDRLKGSKYLWLQNFGDLKPTLRARFEDLKKGMLKVARAWAIKELARSLWHYKTRGWALRAWQKWLAWAMRSRLEPIKKVARMIRKHLLGILNAITLGVTNARAEGINSRIQQIKRMACGYRNRERFRNAIYFHLGGLDLYPRPVPTHTNS